MYYHVRWYVFFVSDQKLNKRFDVIYRKNILDVEHLLSEHTLFLKYIFNFLISVICFNDQ